MLNDLINTIGVRRLARACNVQPGAVIYWKRRGLPGNKPALRAEYERIIARMANMPVAELRKQLEESE